MPKHARHSAKVFAVLVNRRFHAVHADRRVALMVRNKFNAMFARHGARDVAEVVAATVTYDPARIIDETAAAPESE